MESLSDPNTQQLANITSLSRYFVYLINSLFHKRNEILINVTSMLKYTLEVMIDLLLKKSL